MIRINNLCKKFNDDVIFNNANLVIPDNEIIGLFADSGVGKSTLAKILCGVMKIDSGSIYIDDKLLVDEKNKYDRRLGRDIQMVYQQPYKSLDPAQRIKNGFVELIKFNILATKDEINPLIEKTLKQVGLDKKILSHLPSQISGGEAQRVNIAKALLLNSKYLILDEATSMLDVVSQSQVVNLVREIAINRGMSVIFISHDHMLLKHICKRIYYIENGIVEEKE